MDPVYTRDADGFAVVEVEFRGARTVIHSEWIKLTLLDRGAVFLGPSWEGKVPPVVLEADPADSRPEMHLKGFTTDPAVVAAVRRMTDALDADTFDELVRGRG
jgi:hypothetical protein